MENTDVTEQQKKDAEAIAEFIERNIPKNCFTCYHFQMTFRLHKKSGEMRPWARYCRCPDSLKFEQGKCAMWKLEPNPEYRQWSTVCGGRPAADIK